jgi:hypothetical protein
LASVFCTVLHTPAPRLATSGSIAVPPRTLARSALASQSYPAADAGAAAAAVAPVAASAATVIRPSFTF